MKSNLKIPLVAVSMLCLIGLAGCAKSHYSVKGNDTSGESASLDRAHKKLNRKTHRENRGTKKAG